MVTHWIKDCTGKEWPVNYSERVMSQLCRIQGIPFGELKSFASDMNKWELGDIYLLHVLGIRNGARVEHKDIDITVEDFEALIMEVDNTLLAKFMDAFIKSNPDPVEEKKTGLAQARKLGKRT